MEMRSLVLKDYYAWGEMGWELGNQIKDFHRSLFPACNVYVLHCMRAGV